MSRELSVLGLIGGLFLLGAALIAGFSAGPARRELWRNLADTAGFAAAVLVPAAIHPALFSALAAAAGYRCALELSLLRGGNTGAGTKWALAAAASLAAALGAWSGPAVAVVTVLLLGAALAVALVALRSSLDARWAPAVGGALAALAVANLSGLAHREQGFLWVFLLYATVEAQDSMAFLFGKLFGRRRILPRLSPRKTLAGAVAGSSAGLLVGALIAVALLDIPAADGIALAALVVAAGFGGDVLTSALKRAAGAKDFQPVHPRHGGLLDIYDSTLAGAIALGLALGLRA